MEERFDAAVFSGGGCRCFWQAGFWSRAAPQLRLAPNVVAAVSAGAAFACGIFGGTTERVLAAFIRRTRANRRNFYPTRLLRGRTPFPHEAMYRGTILEAFDEAALERLRAGPTIRILMSRAPRPVPAVPAVAVGFAAYSLERYLRRRVHPTLARRLGFAATVVEAQSCQSVPELADLIMHSSCMPPLTPIFVRDGSPVIDGALVDPAPVSLVPEGRQTLVLLARRYARLPQLPGRTYVQPSEDPPVKMWDYASPALIQRAYDLGRRDGDAFAQRARQSSSSASIASTAASAERSPSTTHRRPSR